MAWIARTGLALVSALAVALAAAVAAAEPYVARPLAELLPDGTRYAAGVPTPEQVTGFALGDLVLSPELLAAYVRAVDDASDRVSVEVIGRSHLNRPIFAVTVTSEANQARLPEIRTAQQSALEAGSRAPGADHPVIVEVVHGVHGGETSASDVAPLLLYHLAAAEDAETRALREAAVVTLIVTLNPDGAAREAAWLNTHRAAIPIAHPRHRERGFEFPSGRGNHYWFDLNRQWLPATQPEARAVVGWTQDWLPHVVVDLHEMGGNTSYFIGPGPREGLNPLITDESFELGRALAADVMAAADAEGRLYVSEESFDDFYLGYGSSYPSLLGAVALLFEQSGTDGLVLDGVDGLQRYDEKIAEQFRSTLALIEASAARRGELIDYQRRYFAASDAADADAASGFVFAGDDRARLRSFLELLATHRVETHLLARDVELDGSSFGAGEAFIVGLDQPRRALVRGLFERSRLDEKAGYYDITGWTMPIAFGMDWVELGGGAFAANLLGPLGGPQAVDAPAAPAQAPYAYVLDWGARHAPRTAYRLLAAGARVKMLPAPARVRVADGEVEAPRGALIAPVAEQPLDADALHALMTRAAVEDDVVVHAATSGLTSEGPDLGGFDVEALEAPRVLLVTGGSVSPDEAGEVWRLLDQEMSIPVVMIDQDELDEATLHDFNRLVMADGGYDHLPDGFGATVDTWVRGGGVLIAIRGGAAWATGAGVTSARLLPYAEKPPDGAGARPAYAERARLSAEADISGAIFAIGLDPTHPIAYGYAGERSHVHRAGLDAFIPGAGSAEAVAWYPQDALVAGYAAPESQARLAGATAVFAERRGEGAVVLFADDPLFRGYWLASEKMFLNALFFARAIAPSGVSSYR